MEEYYIGYIFDGLYPPEAAQWCNKMVRVTSKKTKTESMKSLRMLTEKNRNTYLTITRRPYQN